jgi:hypothetical protein
MKFGNLLAILLLLAFEGCRSGSSPVGSTSSESPSRSKRKGLKTELFFGGNSLKSSKWTSFLTTVVSPVLPGFTILDGTGSWRGNLMPAKIIVIFHPGSDSDERHIESIRSQFKSQFGHDSVLRADTPCEYEF